MGKYRDNSRRAGFLPKIIAEEFHHAGTLRRLKKKVRKGLSLERERERRKRSELERAMAAQAMLRALRSRSFSSISRSSAPLRNPFSRFVSNLLSHFPLVFLSVIPKFSIIEGKIENQKKEGCNSHWNPQNIVRVHSFIQHPGEIEEAVIHHLCVLCT